MEFRSLASHWSTEYHSRQYPNVVEQRDIMCYRLENPKDKSSSIIESDANDNSTNDSMIDDDD